MSSEPDGISFHATAPKFVVTNNIDGTMTRHDFPGDDYSQPSTQSVFASGGFRGDLSAVGPDGCIYLTQDGVRFDNGTTSGENSLVKICPGFAPPPGIEGPPGSPSCSDGIDNDGDGRIDDQDEGCQIVPPDRVAQHFRAYRAMGARATQELMTLVDQFGTEEVRLGSVRLLMTPVEKRRQGREPEPIQRPAEHLKCYGIAGADQNRTVTVSNQFRDETVVRVRQPSHLCAPAAKTLEGDPGAPPADVNHYKCYGVNRTPLIGEDVGLSDQFGPDEMVRVLRMIRLCNPVEKRRQGREPEAPPHPTEHLACYQVREPAPFEMRTTFTRDQFRDRETVRVTKPSTLCVPSEKTEQNGT
jgi:hypothetical protein